jgi:hypothetical protein
MPGVSGPVVSVTGRPSAPHHRYDGVVHMFAALELATFKLFYRIQKRKCARELLDFLKVLRRRLARPEALPDLGQLRPTPPPRRPGLVRG